MKRYVNREIESRLAEYLSAFPVVCVTGPRQSGKSTMIRHCLDENYTYVSMDDHRHANLFTEDPEKFFAIYHDRVIFDEVQKTPALFDYIKRAVDNDRQRYGKFVLTGSSQFSLLGNLTETLAGRVGLLSLLPFQYREIPERLHCESLFKGGYPELVMRGYRLWRDWYASYVETYLERDVRSLSNIGNMSDFRRLLRLLAANVSSQLNMSMLAGDIGVSVPTVKRWLSVMEASYIIFTLSPFYRNYGKRITKSPKLYFYDSGLVAFLTGVDSQALYENGPMAGALFENYIVSEVLKREAHCSSHADLFYLRVDKGAEIDLIVDRHGSLEFIEIKRSMTFRNSMVKHLEKFRNQSQRSLLVYAGETMPYTDGIEILNYREYLG